MHPLLRQLFSILQAFHGSRAVLLEFSRARVFANFGHTSVWLGKYEKAIEFYENALVIHGQTGDTSGEGKVLDDLGNISTQLGAYSKALDLYKGAPAICHQIGYKSKEEKLLDYMVNLYFSLNDHHRAISFYEKQLEIRRVRAVFGQYGIV